MLDRARVRVKDGRSLLGGFLPAHKTSRRSIGAGAGDCWAPRNIFCSGVSSCFAHKAG